MNTRIKRILLTGPTGSIGMEALKILDNDSHFKIRIFDRDIKPVSRTLRKFRNIEKVYGQLYNSDSVKRACKNVDIVIHLGALIPPKADEDTKLAWRTNVDGTRNIIEAMQEQNPAGKILYASSISVYGDRLKNPWIKVTDTLQPSEGDYYAQTKIEAEKLIMKSCLEWSIFRVSAVMGVQTTMSSLFFHMPLDTSLEILTARDAGRAFVKAVDSFSQITNKTFDLAGGPKCRTTYKEFLTRVFSIKGLKNPNFPKEAFADQNFHCGYYKDGNVLNDIIDFQSEGLADYYNILAAQQNKLALLLTKIFSHSIKKTILRQSDPLKAFRRGTGLLHRRFFSFSETM